MIRYDLQCENGHAFDAWFSGSDAYDAQRKRRLVQCSLCGSHKVEKAIMAPSIARRDGPAEPMTGESVSNEPALPQPVAAAVPPEMLKAMRAVRQAVEKNADYVGEKFPEEARKIHYGESEARGIYGQATPDETKELKEEGIEVHPLPVLPEDRN